MYYRRWRILVEQPRRLCIFHASPCRAQLGTWGQLRFVSQTRTIVATPPTYVPHRLHSICRSLWASPEFDQKRWAHAGPVTILFFLLLPCNLQLCFSTLFGNLSLWLLASLSAFCWLWGDLGRARQLLWFISMRMISYKVRERNG